MRILQINTNFRSGGIQRHILDLTDYLRGQGHRVTLCGAGGDWLEDVAGMDYQPLDLTRVSQEGGSTVRRMIGLAAVARQLRAILKRSDIDLIHSHETAPALVTRLAAMGLGIPHVMTHHGAEPTRVDEVARIARFSADWVLSPSKTTLAALVDRGVKPERARQLGLGIAHQPAPDPARVAALRAEILQGGEGTICLSLSRLDRQKGIDHMIAVAKAAVATRPDLIFCVAGQGPLTGEVQRWAEAAGVARHFRFPGPVRNVPDYLAAADIYLLTSRWEALPISIVEAMRAGLPVIATDCGGVKELVDAEIGRLLPVGDIDGLTGAVLEIAGDDPLRARLGAAARARSLEDRFEPDKVHATYAAFYQDCIAAGR